MTFKIEKYNADTKTWENFGGGYTKEEVKQITKGYPFDGLMYSRKNSATFFIVTEE